MFQAGSRQHERGLAVGKGADHAGPAPYLPVQALDRVARADAPPMLARHLAVREGLGVAVTHDLGGLLEPHRFQVVGHGLGLGGGRLARLHRVDCLEHGRRLRPLRFRNLGEDVAVEVHGAALVFGVGEDLGDRADHVGGLVAGEHANAAKAARFQPRQEIAPALGRLGEALGAPDHLAVAVLVHADGDHDGDVLVGAAPAAL